MRHSTTQRQNLVKTIRPFRIAPKARRRLKDGQAAPAEPASWVAVRFSEWQPRSFMFRKCTGCSVLTRADLLHGKASHPGLDIAKSLIPSWLQGLRSPFCKTFHSWLARQNTISMWRVSWPSTRRVVPSAVSIWVGSNGLIVITLRRG